MAAPLPVVWTGQSAEVIPVAVATLYAEVLYGEKLFSSDPAVSIWIENTDL